MKHYDEAETLYQRACEKIEEIWGGASSMECGVS
jgi:hypothetical protein